MTTLLAAVMLCALGAISWLTARQPQRRARLIVHDKPGSSRTTAVESVGRWVRALVGRPVDPARDRSVGRALLTGVAAAFVHLGLAAMVVLVVWARSLTQRRAQAQREAERVSAGLADTIDLFAVALLTGTSVAEATRQVCDWSEGEIAEGLAWCLRQVATGLVLSDVLEALPDRLGASTRPLVAALVSTERYGAPIAGSLAQLAAETRSDRRRLAEAAARRLPVALLFPLVVCILPAFLLVTVVPVIIETLSNFDFAASP